MTLLLVHTEQTGKERRKMGTITEASPEPDSCYFSPNTSFHVVWV